MTPQQRQAELDNIDPEALAKIESIKGTSSNKKISRKWGEIGEFGVYFGWPAVVDVYLSGNDLISRDEAMQMMLAARKVQAERTYDMSMAMLSAQPGVKYKDIMQPYIKEMDSVE